MYGFTSEEGTDEGPHWRELGEGIAALRAQAGKPPLAETAIKAEALSKQARGLFSSEYDAYVLNFFDDVISFLHEPRVTPSMAATYLDLRIAFLGAVSWMPASESPRKSNTFPEDEDPASRAERLHDLVEKALARPEMKPVTDYLEFLDLAAVAKQKIDVEVAKVFEEKDGEKVQVAYPSRDYPKIEKLTRAFLSKYPKSHKREAAMLLLARAVFAESRPYYYYGVESSVNGPIVHQREPFNPKRVLAPLDAYDHEFPQGRYAAEIRNFRAYTAWRMGDWGKALDLTLPQLADTTKPDLQPEASMRLANIFADLADAKKRSGLIEAIRTRPEAIKHLAEDLRPALGASQPSIAVSGERTSAINSVSRSCTRRRGNRRSGVWRFHQVHLVFFVRLVRRAGPPPLLDLPPTPCIE